MENAKAQVRAEFTTKDTRIIVNLSVILFEDGGSIVAYCPALNVYGYGKTEIEARKSFEFCLSEFLNYSLKKKTFIAELESLGWTMKKRKKFIAPAFSYLLERNKTLKKVMDTKDFKKISSPVSLPAFA
ncbi:hypothetical protein [uncultured Alistipes sp.]|uniref:hypothetical protein n=1 Tax=uncultured Alistipes sp. TaxID=538949 RepID=UPI00263402A8|nr:hypothetical protein [uncultured Alistipes sp.]